MSEQTMSPETTLWYVAGLLNQESDKELAQHLDHECYAGMLVMQDLILALYPEVEIPVQRTNSEIREVA